jgi:hypothetical protein
MMFRSLRNHSLTCCGAVSIARLFWLIVLHCCFVATTSGKSGALGNDFHAYDLAKLVSRHGVQQISSNFAVNEIERSLQTLCSGTGSTVLKSMDGLTHMLRNTAKDRYG